MGGGIPIYQYDKNGNFIKEWSSSAEVIRTLGISPENGLKRNSAGGFQWSREKVESMSKYVHGSGSYTKCSLYDLWGNLIKTFDAITLMTQYVLGEDCDLDKDSQIFSARLRRGYVGAIFEKYRIAYGDAPTLDNSLNLKQKKKIVVQYDEQDLNTPVGIWANKNIADRELNAHFYRYTENGINGYKYKNIILKILGS